MVKSGEWTKKQYENQIRGIAISKMEREDREKPKTGNPKITKTERKVKSVSGGGSRGQLQITRSGGDEYIMVQSTKKDGSWGKPRALKLYGEESKNPKKALERMTENNPGTKWRFDPDSME